MRYQRFSLVPMLFAGQHPPGPATGLFAVVGAAARNAAAIVATIAIPIRLAIFIISFPSRTGLPDTLKLGRKGTGFKQMSGDGSECVSSPAVIWGNGSERGAGRRQNGRNGKRLPRAAQRPSGGRPSATRADGHRGIAGNEAVPSPVRPTDLA